MRAKKKEAFLEYIILEEREIYCIQMERRHQRHNISVSLQLSWRAAVNKMSATYAKLFEAIFLCIHSQVP